MVEKCANCGAIAVSWDGTEVKVCTECGVIAEEGSYSIDTLAQTASSSEFRVYARSLPSKYIDANQEHSTGRGLKLGRKQIANLANTLKFTQLMKQEVYSLFEKAYYHPTFKSVRIEHKMILVACCIYVVTLNHGWPMSVDQIGVLTKYPVHKIMRLKTELCKAFDIKLQHLDITNLVEPLCNKAEVGDECYERTKRLIMLCKTLWLSDGRKPSLVITAAMYLAWQSQNWMDRRVTKFNVFCKERHMNAGSGRTRVVEMQKALVTLAKQIPWLTDDEFLNDKNVVEHLGDICHFQQSLLIKAMEAAQKENNLENEMLPSSSSCGKTKKTDTKRKWEESEGRPYVGQLNDPPSFKVARQDSEKDEKPKGEIKCIMEYTGDLNSEELNEADIPDNEMINYLKSEEEIKTSDIVKDMKGVIAKSKILKHKVTQVRVIKPEKSNVAKQNT